jgi:uncharacterized protein DUF4238
MPLDHFVSQVHLKKFYSPILGERMYAVRKSDLKEFTPNSQSVCRIMDGSTNSYLVHDRAIEDFLKTVEPTYDSALASCRDNSLNTKLIHAIAGFVAYIVCCSPTAMRINSEPLKSTVESTALLLDSQGKVPPAPEGLGGKSLTDLLQKGEVKIEVDRKYPQAMGIASILQHTARFGSSRWEILHNTFPDSPFFTSDFPVAIERGEDRRVLNRIVPLAPDLAIRIVPDLILEHDHCTLGFSQFSVRSRRLTRNEVISINCLLVRCAEDIVFYRDNLPWVKPFVTKNRRYRIETRTEKIPTPSRGFFLLSSQAVCERREVNGQEHR